MTDPPLISTHREAMRALARIDLQAQRLVAMLEHTPPQQPLPAPIGSHLANALAQLERAQEELRRLGITTPYRF